MPAAAPAATPAEVEDSIIVRFKPGTSATEQKAVLNKVAAENADGLGIAGVRRVELPAAESRDEAITAIENHPAVDWVEKDVVMKTAGRPVTDALRTSAWNMHKIDAPGAWNLVTGTGTTIAVLDTGVAFTNPALAGAQWINPGEIAGNGIDDDGNGFVDDVAGWDFVNGDASPQDEHGHGTQVSGVAAGRGGGLGVVGVAPRARIMAIQVCTPRGGCPLSSVVSGLAYARRMGADVANMSLAWGADLQAVRAAVEAAPDLFVVAASGNNGIDLGQPGVFFSPCELAETHANVICVGATTSLDALARFSNRGPAVTVVAPGYGIETTSHLGGTITATGTSMAAPHVAGAAALRIARGGVNSLTLRRVLEAGTDQVAAGPRLNAQKVVTTGMRRRQ